MESLTSKPKSKGLPINRIALSEDAAKKLDLWAEQMEVFCPGIRLKRQQIIDWLISEKGAQLTASEQRSIKDQFYDDVELVTWALSQLKAAKAKNEKLSLADLLKRGQANKLENNTKKSKKKSPPTSKNEVPQIEGATTAQLEAE